MPTPTHKSRPSDVVVIGCGHMGSALARTLAQSGLDVAVWNRTSSRAKALDGKCITAVTDLAEAVRSLRLVIGCTHMVDSLREALALVSHWGGGTLANLVTTTPRQAEAMSISVQDRGGHYLDGSIMCYPSEIGTEAGFLAYSGSDPVWRSHPGRSGRLGPAFVQ